MDDVSRLSVWLENSAGERWAVQGSCALGRSSTNQVVLPDNKVSRRHSMIHSQGEGEFWLVDLGSSNGTYLNGRRLVQPTRLRDHDQIAIAQFVFVFRQPVSPSEAIRKGTLTTMTITDIRTLKCWLLIADIVGSTELSNSLSPDQLSVVTGTWLASCQQIVDNNGGSINKFLGDGFFAYWHEQENVAAAVAQAIHQLKPLQAIASPVFRIVLHFGAVAVGGAVTMGEESLLGNEVNFVFRMEKLAGAQSLSCLMSEAAQAQLKSMLTTTEAGRHSLAGFGKDYLFFTF